jgi:hypothetical protein
MCGSVLQDWLVGRDHSIPIPGTRVEHYSWAVILPMQILTLAWVFWPLLFLFRRRLAEKPVAAAEIPRPNVRFLLAWTTMAALLLAALRLIAQHGAPLKIGIAFEPVQTALLEHIAKLPLCFAEVISVAFIMIAFSGKPMYWLWSVPLAVLFRFGSHEIVIWSTLGMGFPSVYGVLAGPPNERLPHLAGTVFTAIVVSFVARVTGLIFRPADQSTVGGAK